MVPENDLVLRESQNWASRSHRELYDSVHHNNDPGQAGELGSEWAQFGAELTESAQLIAKRVAASEAGWTGDAAEGARAAIRELAEWITLTARTAVEVGNRISAQGRIMATARATMPEPPAFNLDAAARGHSTPGLAGFTASAADMQAASEKARAAHEQAVTVMETMERQSQDIDAGTPAFTLPYNPVTGKAQEPPQPMMLRSSDGPSLSGASAPPPVGPSPTQDTSAPPQPSGGTQPLAPAASYSGPAGSPPAPESPSYQPAAHQPHADGTAAAAATAYQLQAGGHSAPAVSAYSVPPEHRPQPYGTPMPWTQQGAPHTTGSRSTSRTAGTTDSRSTHRTAGTTDPRGVQRTAGTTGPSSSDPRNPAHPAAATAAGGPPATGPRPAAHPATGSGGRGGSGGGGGFGGAAPGGFPAGPLAAGGSSSSAQMQPGDTAGVTKPGRGPAPAGGVGPGAAAAAGVSPAGGVPMGGPMAGKGEEDKEHRSASYVMGGDLFEVPGENLPPAVIGGAKPKKRQPPEQST